MPSNQVIIILVESRFIFICNSFPLLSFRRLLIHTWNYFSPQNKFFDNHEYSRRSLKLLLFLDLGQWCMGKSMKCELSFRALTAARHNSDRIL